MVTDELAARNVEIVCRGQRETVDVLGIWCKWKTTEAETNHHYSVMEMIVPPGVGVPLHRHAIQETFTVLDGSAEFGRLGEAGEEWRPIATGDVVNVPNWAYHGFRNSGSSPARIQLTCAAGLEAFFRECGIRVEPGSTPNGTPPSGAEIERVATIAAKHGSFFQCQGFELQPGPRTRNGAGETGEVRAVSSHSPVPRFPRSPVSLSPTCG